jgi:Ni,Fe-hydrogenase III large subunit
MCNCLDKVRNNIILIEDANYVRIDMSTILVRLKNGKEIENLTGQRIEIGYNHIKRDGTVQKKERKSFITHDYCPFCGKKYIK